VGGARAGGFGRRRRLGGRRDAGCPAVDQDNGRGGGGVTAVAHARATLPAIPPSPPSLSPGGRSPSPGPRDLCPRAPTRARSEFPRAQFPPLPPSPPATTPTPTPPSTCPAERGGEGPGGWRSGRARGGRVRPRGGWAGGATRAPRPTTTPWGQAGAERCGRPRETSPARPRHLASPPRSRRCSSLAMW